MGVLQVYNSVSEVAIYYYEANKQAREEKAGPVLNEVLPFYLERLDKQAKNNNGYLACGRVCIS